VVVVWDIVLTPVIICRVVAIRVFIGWLIVVVIVVVIVGVRDHHTIPVSK
jgi:hypothetical protein